MVHELLRNDELENIGKRQEDGDGNQKIGGNGKKKKAEWLWNGECE